MLSVSGGALDSPTLHFFEVYVNKHRVAIDTYKWVREIYDCCESFYSIR